MEFKPPFVARRWMVAACALALLAAPARAQEAAQDPAATGTAAQLPSAIAADPSEPAPSSTPTDPTASGTAAKATEAAAADPSLPTTADEPTSVTPGSSAPAGMKQDDVECTPVSAEITDLREPRFGGGTAWDITYPHEGMDVFSDVLPLDPETLVAAGAFTRDKEDGVYHPLLVKFDARLKPVWEVRIDTKEQQTIHRVLKSKGGFTVLGDMTDGKRGNGIYIASYTDDGKVRGKPAPIYEAGGDLDAKAMIPAQDGGGYIIAAQFINTKDQENQYGLLYKVSNAGNIVWKRSFKPGQSTVFHNVQATQDGSYVVTGQIVTSSTRSAGWMVRVDRNGSIQAQRTYPRGMAATLQAAAQTKQGEFLFTGKIRSFDAAGKGLAAWVMKTDSTGNPLWQRFFRGVYDYEAPDLIVYEDGRASVLLNGGGMDSEHRSHARLLTFSPQGQIQHLEDFTQGQNAAAHRLVSGLSGERILTGYAQTSFGENQEGNEASAAPAYTYDGWIAAAPPLDSYEDTCAAGPKMSPILP